MSSAADPLIITARLDHAAASRFNSLRQKYFPPAINYLNAHVTLFHCLPGSLLAQVKDYLQHVCGHQSTVKMTVNGLRFLGRGVAYSLESPRLSMLRRQLARAWEPSLTAQDSQPFRPHITVQNKVDPAEATRLYQDLRAAFQPWQITGVGIELWDYRGGPWEPAAFFPFTPPASELLPADECRSSPPD